MRKLFFMLAFMLVGTFGFANNSVEIPKVETEKTQKKLENLKIYKLNLMNLDGTCTIYHFVYFNGRYIGSFEIEAPDDHPDCNGVIFHMNDH